MSNSIASPSSVEGMDLSNPHKLRELTQALIKFSMHDGDRASQELSVRLANIQRCFDEISNQLETGEQAAGESSGEINAIDKEAAQQSIQSGISEIMNCLIELQFFDRISQRMDHAVQSLEADSADEQTQKEVANIFTMQDERILYTALLEGCSVDEAVQKANADLINVVNTDEDDIELF